MEKYSRNKKLNGVLNEIREDLLAIHDTEEESINEIKRYMKEFPYMLDYNLYGYGNMLIYDHDIRQMYARNGYKSIAKMSAIKMRETYKRQVGYVARSLFRN